MAVLQPCVPYACLIPAEAIIVWRIGTSFLWRFSCPSTAAGEPISILEASLLLNNTWPSCGLVSRLCSLPQMFLCLHASSEWSWFFFQRQIFCLIMLCERWGCMCSHGEVRKQLCGVTSHFHLYKHSRDQLRSLGKCPVCVPPPPALLLPEDLRTHWVVMGIQGRSLRKWS